MIILKRQALFYYLFFLSLIFQCITGAAQDTVSISGRTILLNKSPYKIRGICYSSIAKGKSYIDLADYSHLATDISLMQNACINTIRTYFPITDESVLDAFAAAGIKIIMGIPIADSRTVKGPEIMNGTYVAYINTYKTHPAILMWEFGNEYNFHPEWFGNNISNWYTYLNNAAAAAHLADLAHPVSTAHGELPDLQARTECPNIDVWGMNVYRWDNPAAVFGEWLAVSTKPMYLSESGADSFDNISNVADQVGAATAIKNIWADVKGANTVCSGITFFEFVDEWWKAAGSTSSQGTGGFSVGVPYDGFGNQEYFGIVDIDRNEKQGYTALKELYCLAAGNTSSKNENSSSFIYAYPNPTKDKITLNFEHTKNEEAMVTVSDLLSKTLITKRINATSGDNHVDLYLGELENGIYILTIQVGEGKMIQKMEVVK